MSEQEKELTEETDKSSETPDENSAEKSVKIGALLVFGLILVGIPAAVRRRRGGAAGS